MVKTVQVPIQFESIFAAAEKNLSDFFCSRKDNPERGTIEILGERYLLLRAAPLAVEFFQQIEHIFDLGNKSEANQFCRSFLYDLAHTIGIANADELHGKLNLTDPIAKLSAGPVEFSYSGCGLVEILPESHPVPDENFLLIYNHHNSFEADTWIQAKKPTDLPVCVMNAGWSSGWCQESFGIDLVSSEILCRARGDKSCRFIMAPPDKIEERIRDYIRTHPQEDLQKRYEIPHFFSRQKAEQHLRQVYRNLKELDQMKTQFFSNVSHELRTPLTLILGPTERLLASSDLKDEHRTDLKIILRNAQALLKHVNDLLNVSKLEAGKVGPYYTETDLAALLHLNCSFFEAIALERKINFTQDSPESLIAQVDAEMIGQILINLLSNAFKFVPDSGKIACRLSTENDQFVFSIRDNGPGIPTEMKEAIFERYRQVEGENPRRLGGTGLGLAIAREFTELHRGTIHVEDAPGGGAEFIVKIPIRAPTGTRIISAPVKLRGPLAPDVQAVVEPLRPFPALDSQGHGPISKGPNPRGTVLVVEDNPEMNHLISQTLSMEFTVLTAFDGKEGLEQAIEHRPDLILSDIMMPIMSGEQMILEIRRKPELDGTPIILLTAKTDQETKIKLLREGAQDYLIKPFAIEELRVRTRNQVSMKRARDLLQRELSERQFDIEQLAQDVTSRQRALEKSLKETQDANEKVKQMLYLRDEFISLASHELRTPLTPLKLHCQLLKLMADRLPNPQVTRKSIDGLEQEINRLASLVNHMLDVSQIRLGNLALNLEEVDLAEVIRDVTRRLQPEIQAARSSIEFHTDRDTKGHWDRARIEQITTHLLSNAIKYGEGKPIRITIKSDQTDIVLSIQDFGIGIDIQDQARIFDRFERAVSFQSFSGLGLGLYITRQLVLAHHGTIDLESQRGAGTIFKVRLPKQRG